MKQTAKRILAFVSVVCIAFIGVFTMPFVSVNAAEGQTAQLVTDASTLAVGDQVIIAAASADVALSTTQNTNNRGYVAIETKSDNTATIGDTVQVLTLEAGTVDGTFAFNTGSGYLYAASSSSNNLKTKSSKDANGSWTITIDPKGVATVKAQGNNSRNSLRYNSSNKLFSCYASGQQAICLYKLEVDESVPTITISTESNINQAQVDDKITFKAETTNAGDSPEINWTSTNPAVATFENNVLTAVDMGKTTVTATITVNGKTADDSMEVTVYPKAGAAIEIVEALTVCELVGNNKEGSLYTYSTTGVIQSINTVYSSEDNNITVTITDGTNSLMAYKMTGGSDLKVNDTITVTGKLTNYNGNTPEFVAGATYEKVVNTDIEKILEDLNKVNAWMSLAYKYDQKTEMVDVPAVSEVVDTLDRAFTGVTTGTAYVTWTGKTAESSAVYAGNSAPGNSSIQLRTDKDKKTGAYSGVVTTTSGGKARKVEIKWYSGTNNARVLQVYGSNTAYSSAADLFDTNKQGTLLGELAFASNQTTVVIEGDYEYIGLRSKSGALYLTEVQITWEVESGTTGDQVEKVVLSDSQFRLKFGVDESLFAIENVSDFGITITAGEKTKTYNSKATLNWKYDEENNRKYVVIDLGDIVNDKTKLTTEFTVQTYVVVGERTFKGNTKTYSVAGMIAEYHDQGVAEVEVLYNYLKDKGAI